ncbi:mRNA-binding protein PUF3 SCDLUD_004467 [Saccharomycodes ludwigii]|uniref:mRNA-binding protein PUF3 n=1 Tax=Saccharomycodes ludwigii TaxID=36035 RepID=UPI001E89FD0B|nr:hypothetical protein SCDLUD_004467 [Saccharomycodes ludwigii]KAH3899045.1 hypothetical protein SCDLUD_004467 [Saccharomycodes ludwigii]
MSVSDPWADVSLSNNSGATKTIDAELQSIVSSLSALSNPTQLQQSNNQQFIGSYRRGSINSSSDIGSDILLHQTSSNNTTGNNERSNSNTSPVLRRTTLSVGGFSLNTPNGVNNRLLNGGYSASIAVPLNVGNTTSTNGVATTTSLLNTNISITNNNASKGGFFERFGKTLVEQTREIEALQPISTKLTATKNTASSTPVTTFSSRRESFNNHDSASGPGSGNPTTTVPSLLINQATSRLLNSNSGNHSAETLVSSLTNGLSEATAGNENQDNIAASVSSSSSPGTTTTTTTNNGDNNNNVLTQWNVADTPSFQPTGYPYGPFQPFPTTIRAPPSSTNPAMANAGEEDGLGFTSLSGDGRPNSPMSFHLGRNAAQDRAVSPPSMMFPNNPYLYFNPTAAGAIPPISRGDSSPPPPPPQMMPPINMMVMENNILDNGNTLSTNNSEYADNTNSNYINSRGSIRSNNNNNNNNNNRRTGNSSNNKGFNGKFKGNPYLKNTNGASRGKSLSPQPPHSSFIENDMSSSRANAASISLATSSINHANRNSSLPRQNSTGQHHSQHRNPGNTGYNHNHNNHHNNHHNHQNKQVIYRSPLLEEFRSNSSKKTYTLGDIFGSVLEFSKDQHGSRFIQQQLPIANDTEKEMVFNEIRDYTIELCSDVFGNYVIQKFFEHGNDIQRATLVESLKEKIHNLSLQMYGCRVIQRALDFINEKQRCDVINELSDYVLECIKDQNGNHVIQKAIETIPIDKLPFVLASLKGHIYHLSTHPYGCRVVQRLLEFGTLEDQSRILNELSEFFPYLIQDQYGNYVVQHILEASVECGSFEDILKSKQIIIDLISNRIVDYSRHKFASNVVEKSIILGNKAQKKQILDQILPANEEAARILDENEPIAVMMKDQFANYVIQKLVSITEGQVYRLVIISIKSYLRQVDEQSRALNASNTNANINNNNATNSQFHSVNSTKYQNTNSNKKNKHLASVEKLSALVENIEIS